jgi:hypothetical protein
VALAIEELDPKRHDRAGFDCGVEPLNRYLRTLATQHRTKGIATTFDPAAQDALCIKAHEKYVNDALFLFVGHDLNARAMNRRVQGFVQAQNWFQDFSPITMAR